MTALEISAQALGFGVMFFAAIGVYTVAHLAGVPLIASWLIAAAVVTTVDVVGALVAQRLDEEGL